MKELRRTLLFVTALVCLLFTTVAAYAAGAYSDIVADPNTMESYKDKLLTDENGSRYAGRVWSDKSVVANTDGRNVLTLTMDSDGYDGNVTFDSTFGHIYSALASSQVVNEYPPSPIDLVIVIDMSASMGQDTRFGIDNMGDTKVDHNSSGDGENHWPEGGVPMEDRIANSRVQKTLDAINQTIDTLMAQNMQNRVSVVGYGANATVIMPLAHYRKVGDEPYLKVGGMETLYHPSDLMVHDGGWYWRNNRDTTYTIVLDAEKCEETTKLTEQSRWEKIENVVSNNVNGGAQGKGVKAFPGVEVQTPATLKESAEKYQDEAEQAANEAAVIQNAKSKLADLVKDTKQLKANDYVGYFTNTQGGTYLGFKQLADTSARVYSEVLSTGEISTVARVPAAIIMSDGGANFALNSMEPDVNNPQKLLPVENWNARFAAFAKDTGSFIDYKWDEVVEWSGKQGDNYASLGKTQFSITVTGASESDKLKFMYKLLQADGAQKWGSSYADVSPVMQPDGSAKYTIDCSVSGGESVCDVAVAIKEGMTVTDMGGSTYTAGGVLPDFYSVGTWYMSDDSWGSDDQGIGHPGDLSHRLGTPNKGDEWWNVYLPGPDTLDDSKVKWDGLHGLCNPGADYFFDGTLCGSPASIGYGGAGVLYCDAVGDLTGTSAPALSVVATAAYMRTIVDTHYRNGWTDGGASPESQIPLSIFTMDVDTVHVPQWGRWRLYPSLNPSKFYPGDAGSWINDNVYYFGTTLGGSDWGNYGSYSIKDVLLGLVFPNNMQKYWNQFAGGGTTIGDGSGATVSQGVYLNMVALASSGAGTTYHAGGNDTITLTHEQVMANAKYNDGFYDASTDALSGVFSDILELILGKVFVPVSGDNDAGIGDSITYQDPIGEYMEVKNQAVKTVPLHTDESLGLPETAYDMAVLLFGEMHGLYRGGTYDYKWNSEYLANHGGSGTFQLGWYKGDAASADGPYTTYQDINSAKGTQYASQQDAWADGWTLRLDYKTLALYVPIVNVEPGAQELPEQLRNTVYNVYQFACTKDERNRLRKNPVYGELQQTEIDGWEAEKDRNGGQYPDNNSYYKDMPGVYRLSDIRVWVEDTGDYVDTSGAFTPNAGYNQSLYVNIPAVALPTQLAEITLGPDGPLAYETNLGSDHPDGVVDVDGNETTHAEFCYQSTPVRVFYGVGLEDKILQKDAEGNTTGVDFSAISAEYVASHTDENDRIYFLSNFYSNTPYDGYATDTYDGARTRGDPTVTFSPGGDNRYYVFQKPLPLYAHAYTVSGDSIVPIDKQDSNIWTDEENTRGGNGQLLWRDTEGDRTGGDAWAGGPYMGVYASKQAFEAAWAAAKATGIIEDANGAKYATDESGIVFLQNDVLDSIGEGAMHLSSDDYYFIVVDYYSPEAGEGKDINGKTIPGSRAGSTHYRAVTRKGAAFGSAFESEAIQAGDMLCWTDMSVSWNSVFDYGTCVNAGDIERGEPTWKKLTLKKEDGSLREYLESVCHVKQEYLDEQVDYWTRVQQDETVAQKLEHADTNFDGQVDAEEYAAEFKWALATRPGGIRTGDMANNIQSKSPNTTQTSYNYYLPTVSNTSGTGDDLRLNLYLGNNGRLSIANYAMYLGKTVNVPEDDDAYADLLAKRFDFDVYVDGYAGERTVSKIVFNPWANSGQGAWQQQVDTLDALVSNAGIMLDSDYVAIKVDASGNPVQKEIPGEQYYYVYAGVDASADDSNIVNLYSSAASPNDAGRTVYVPKGTDVPLSDTATGTYWTVYKTEDDAHPAGSIDYWLKDAWLIPAEDISKEWTFDNAQIGRYKHIGFGQANQINDPATQVYSEDVQPFYVASIVQSAKGPNLTTTSAYSLRTMFVSDVLTFDAGTHTATANLGHWEGYMFEGLGEGVQYHVYEKLPLSWCFELTKNSLVEQGKEIKTDATHTDEAGQGFDDETSVSQEGVLFVNSYLPRVSLNLEILKKYQDKDTGRDIPISEGEFKFALTPTGDAPMPEDVQEGRSIVSTDTDGKVIWPEIEYTKVGEWDYTIQEQDPGDSNIIWDEEAHKVHVSVTRDGDYVLHAKWTWGDENLDAADAIISNFRLSAVHLPSTGGDGTGLWLALGLALMVMGVSWYSLYRRARREA